MGVQDAEKEFQNGKVGVLEASWGLLEVSWGILEHLGTLLAKNTRAPVVHGGGDAEGSY